ncbi:MAG: dihydrolipoyl dehydrogenase [Christensenella sp.]|uniref:dihydrolipoyl dehydrogenase n=1 Tax=Christensenella sp. TaxID=1935934 RepID=UPI002B21F7FD|nr:dihydrolipoyl dehydrogenase [Christensenella sp.]MEA5003116.1 dihydrolipoyl dehydrogenase [Christensenella sp.]
MAEKIIMPKAGMSMEFGTIIKWLKEVGDKVEYGEPVLEIETDKTSMQVEAMNDGYILSRLYEAGAEVPVVTTIGYIGEKGETPPAGDAPAAAAPTAAPAPAAPAAKAEPREGKNYDVVVLGGGPAGYIAAIKAARLGAKTAVVEKSALGGTCLNRGCIPTKTYLKTAEIIHETMEAKKRGVIFKDLSYTVDMKGVVAEKNGVVKKLVSGVTGLMKSNGIDVYRGEGKIQKDKTIVIDGKETVSADKVIFAGGSKVTKINIPGIESPAVMTSDDILDLEELPEKLVVIGGGVVGVEMASAFRAFGSEVTVLEMMDRIVPGMEGELSNVLKQSLKAQGIDVRNGVGILKIEQKGKKAYVHLKEGDPVEADKILLSIGRMPDLSGIEDIDVAVDERGRVKVDDGMKTNIDWIWAPGDSNGRMMLAHAAFNMAEIAAENAMGAQQTYTGKYIPSCIYTTPELASVGLKEDDAKKAHDVSIGKFFFAGNGRALASGAGDGFIKVVTDSKTGEILGVHIVGPCAAEMINEACALMTMEITAYEVPTIVHAHPSFSEALMEAVADSIGESLHLPKKR